MDDDYVASESNKRIVNNAMRHQYRVLNETEKAVMVRIKDTGLDFILLLNEVPNGRERSIAITKIEEAVMWAVKALTA